MSFPGSLWVGVPCYPCHCLSEVILAITGAVTHMHRKLSGTKPYLSCCQSISQHLVPDRHLELTR